MDGWNRGTERVAGNHRKYENQRLDREYIVTYQPRICIQIQNVKETLHYNVQWHKAKTNVASVYLYSTPHLE